MKDDLKQRLLTTFALALTFMVIMQYMFPPPPPPPLPDADNTLTATQDDSGDKGPEDVPGTDDPGTTGESDPGTEPGTEPTGDTPATQEVPEAEAVVESIRIRRTGTQPEDGYEAVFTSRGAALRQYRLLGYYRTPEHTPGDEMVLADTLATGRLSLVLRALGEEDIASRNYTVVTAPKDAILPPAAGVVPRNQDNRLVFETVTQGWRVRKTYTFPPERPRGFELEVEVENLTDTDRLLSYRLVGPAGIVPDDGGYLGKIEGMSAALEAPESTDVEVNRLQALAMAQEDDPLELNDPRSNLAWLGARNRFFAALLLARDAGTVGAAMLQPLFVSPAYVRDHPEMQIDFLGQTVKLSDVGTVEAMRDAVRADETLVELFRRSDLDLEKLTRDNIIGQIAASPTVGGADLQVFVNAAPEFVVEQRIDGRATLVHGFSFYGGPTDETMLAAFDPRLQNVTAYTVGLFTPVSRGLLWLLQKIASVVINYGVAMIILTLLVKSCLHPLTKKALTSGHKMQALQPKMKALEAKYKNDQAKLNQEKMRLFQEEGVNPLGGCLPMLIQLPLFFALYGAFAKGFASRQAVFIPGWIDDLSRPDHLFQLPFTVPVVGWQYFNLLPVLYLVLQIIHMSMQPKSDNPQMQQQQQMMKFMPIMFMFFFYQMPSGLVLYFATSSAYTIVEHYFIKKNLPPHESGTTSGGLAAAAASAGGSAEASPSPAGAGVGVSGTKGGKKGKKKKR